MAHEESGGISRRTMLAGAGLLAASAARATAAPSGKLKVAIFSKHLQFVRGEELPRLAAEIGFDAIDITVRKGGHIEPDRVRQELPGLVALIRKHGLEVPMITTDIVDTSTPYTEDILRTMADLGIRHYRWNNFRYVDNKPIVAQLEALRPTVAKLAELNKKYQVGAMYHTHSGVNLVGASFWDLHILMDGMDPNAVGVNFDIGHATVEGGLGGRIVCGELP
jgi:sugar phosphate isomerase/epimerase